MYMYVTLSLTVVFMIISMHADNIAQICSSG